MSSYTDPHNSTESWAPWSLPQKADLSSQIRCITQFVQLQILALPTPAASSGRGTQISETCASSPSQQKAGRKPHLAWDPLKGTGPSLGLTKCLVLCLGLQMDYSERTLGHDPCHLYKQFSLKRSQALAELQSGQHDSQIILAEEQSVSQP